MKAAAATEPQSDASRTLAAFHEERAVRGSSDWRLAGRTMEFVRPHARSIALSLGTLLVVQGLGLLRPLLMGRVASTASVGDGDALFRAGISLAALVVGTQILSFAQIYTMQLAGARAMADMRAAIFHHLQRLRLRFFDRTPIGRLVTRATNDVDAVSELFASGALNAVGDLVALVGIVAMMVALDWRMAIVSFAALPFVVVFVEWIRSRARAAQRAIRTRTARLNAFLNEQVTGIAVVQAFARETTMAEEYDEINRAYRDASKRSVFYEALLDAAIEMVGTVCIASTLVWAGIETRMASIGVEGVTFEKVVVFTQYIRQFFEPVSMLSQRYTVLQGALAGAERIFELLDETDVEGESVEPPSEPPVPIAGAPAVVFDQVSFSYKRGTSALRDVSFRIEAGQFVGIVGATGAGKTTLVQLLLQLYPQDEGTISVFGHDASAMTPESLRRLFAVVPQDVFLFSGSILDNIAVGAKAPDRERARSALQRAHAWDLVEAREGGLDAPVDERGSNFSAGERQLLAFARALYVDAPVFLLDEATASVDSDTELRLKRAFEEVRQGRTALVIAHRLATIRAADQILVFHRGRLEERGSHRELMDAQGIYARLSSLQSSHDRGMGANGSRDDASRSFVA